VTASQGVGKGADQGSRVGGALIMSLFDMVKFTFDCMLLVASLASIQNLDLVPQLQMKYFNVEDK